jgi:hypothetical protein
MSNPTPGAGAANDTPATTSANTATSTKRISRQQRTRPTITRF